MSEKPIFYRDQLSERAGIRSYYRQELARRLDFRFWKSPDIPIAQSVLMPPGRSMYIPISFPGNLEIFDNLPVDVITYMETSTRSRFAQVGLEVHSAGQLIAESL